MKRIASALVLVALVVAASAATAQAPVKGFRADFLAQQDGVEKELLGLAEATPPEKFSWRPAEGVRSISEVYTHTAGANYMLMSFAGVKPPEGASASENSMEKTVTEKAAVIAELKKSFAHLRASVISIPDADLEKPVTYFGRKGTIGGLILLAATHEHEHLGQSIAYARMNGIVPPWSQPKAKPAEKPAK
jgi:uncharacterized damage-inducible protein DinB